MATWKFQFCPNEPDVINVGYRMDEVGEDVEREVNAALRLPFRFHGVSKIVVRLGPSQAKAPDYHEVLGVGRKQYPSFDASSYLAHDDTDRRRVLIGVVDTVFVWFRHTFDDADFVRMAADRLSLPHTTEFSG